MSNHVEDNNSYSTKLPFFGIPKVLPYVLKRKKLMLTIAITMMIISLIDIIIPLYQKFAIDNFISAENTSKSFDNIWIFVAFVVLYFITVLIQSIGTVIMIRKSTTAEMYIGRDLKNDTFNKLQTLSFSYYNQNSVGYLHSRVMSDTSRIGETLSWGLVDGVWSLIYIIGSFVVMFTLDWRLSLIVLTIVPIVIVFGSYFQRKLILTNRKVRETNSHITGKYNEGITGAKTIKSLSIEDKMFDDFSNTTYKMRKVSIRAARFRGLFVASTAFFCSIGIAIVMWYGTGATAENIMKLGTLSAFATYALGLLDPLQNIAFYIGAMVNMQVNIERVTKLIETEPEITDKPEIINKYGDTFNPKKENWEPIKGDIEFKDVSFKYPDGDEYVLEHFNLKLKAGTTVAIVGETGAGKSTIVNLVCRFFEPTSGQILIDGIDYRERSQLWLHSNIGYVLQTPHLFSGSIYDNIRYGKLEASKEEIEAAAKCVNADEVIKKMEKGYDSDVGEAGDLLSTGEKQLISFARAVLVDPRIFILDEATSSIDTLTEQRIQSALKSVLKDRTSFLIAHRLSTIRYADIILVVKDGKIIESGTHDELFNLNGYYFNLYTQQYDKDTVESFLGKNK